jgi:hypothetical protein
MFCLFLLYLNMITFIDWSYMLNDFWFYFNFIPFVLGILFICAS